MADNPLLSWLPGMGPRQNSLLDNAPMYYPPEARAASPEYVPPQRSVADMRAQMPYDLAGGTLAGRTVQGFAESPAAIKAYHGSPHSFDRFDMSKLGSGEGAQAYGHGLYFAGDEAVARSYQRQLAPGLVDRAGKPVKLPATVDAMAALDTLQQHGGDYDAAIAAVKGFRQATTHAGTRQEFDNMLDQFDVWRGSGTRPGGHMYEVNLQTEPNRLLNWDKPLGQQSQHVQDALSGKTAPGASTVRPVEGGFVVDYLSTRGPRTSRVFQTEEAARRAGDATREIMQDSLRDWTRGHESSAGGSYRVGPEHAKVLKTAGVDGIRYLDGGSRSAGAGTHNVVMFDDAQIEILRKYGLLPLATGGAAAAGTGTPAAEGEPQG